MRGTNKRLASAVPRECVMPGGGECQLNKVWNYDRPWAHQPLTQPRSVQQTEYSKRHPIPSPLTKPAVVGRPRARPSSIPQPRKFSNVVITGTPIHKLDCRKMDYLLLHTWPARQAECSKRDPAPSPLTKPRPPGRWKDRKRIIERIIEFLHFLAMPENHGLNWIRHTYLENGGYPAPGKCLDVLRQCTRYPYG